MGELDEKFNAILNDPQAMGKIMALARSLGGDGGEEEKDRPEERSVSDGGKVPPMGDIDPRLLQLGMKLMGEYRREDDQKAQLLMALRPFVRESRWEKLDRAVQAARLSRVLRVLFESVGKGERHV